MTIWKNILNGTISFLICIVIMSVLLGFIFLALYIVSITPTKILGGIFFSMALLALWATCVAIAWK